jgi:hypothetical protein
MTPEHVHAVAVPVPWLTDPTDARALAHELMLLARSIRDTYPDRVHVAALLKTTAECVAEHAADIDELYRDEVATFAADLPDNPGGLGPS